MGQKVNPNGLRLGVNKNWQSNWFADKDYAVKLNNDIKIREYLLKTLSDAAVSLLLLILSWPSLTLLFKKSNTELFFCYLKENLLPICITLY